MCECALGQRGQGFMQTHDHEIRAAFQRFRRESAGKAEMRAVRLIHQHRDAPSVRGVRDRADIADHPLIRGRRDHHELRVRMLPQRALHLLGRDAPADPRLSVGLRHKIHGLQQVQLGRVIDGFMAVARHDDFLSAFHRAPDGGQNPGGAAVDEQKGPPAAV